MRCRIFPCTQTCGVSDFAGELNKPDGISSATVFPHVGKKNLQEGYNDLTTASVYKIIRILVRSSPITSPLQKFLIPSAEIFPASLPEKSSFAFRLVWHHITRTDIPTWQLYINWVCLPTDHNLFHRNLSWTPIVQLENTRIKPERHPKGSQHEALLNPLQNVKQQYPNDYNGFDWKLLLSALSD